MTIRVSVRRSRLVPPRAAAWVPLPGLVLVRAGVPLTERLLAHELQHVLQARRWGLVWPLAYALQWARTGFRYWWMPYEIEARAAEKDLHMLAWARDVLRGIPWRS